MLLSVIVPCYNEEENVPIFYEEMMKNSAFLEQEKLELEIIYIDDGSKDNTAAEVRKLHEKDERAGQPGALCVLLPQLWQGSRNLCGLPESKGGLCRDDGR